MDRLVERKTTAIMEILRDSHRPLGARRISRLLHDQGIELTERAVRYHLLHMDDRGLTRMAGGSGRTLTERGLQEISSALAVERVGFVDARIDSLAYQTSFDPEKREGLVVLNLSFFRSRDFEKAVKAMRPVFDAGIGLSDLVLTAGAGEYVGDTLIPEGHRALATVCSVSLNGILLRHGIPVESRFGGLLEMRDGKATRFTDIINYSGSTLDPIEIFIKGRMTDVSRAATTGDGLVCASFREVPSASLQRVQEVLTVMRRAGMAGMVLVGRPNQSFMEVPVGRGRTGIVVAGGLNPVAAAEEAGIATEMKAMVALADFSLLQPA
jgi:repressor of nif and glnA expression